MATNERCVYLLLRCYLFLNAVHLLREVVRLKVHCKRLMNAWSCAVRYARTFYPVCVHLDHLIDDVNGEASFPLRLSNFLGIPALIVDEVEYVQGHGGLSLGVVRGSAVWRLKAS